LSVKREIPRGFELALFATSLLWAGAAALAAGKVAQGLALRFSLWAMEPLLDSVILLFLVVAGFQMLDWIARGTGEAQEVLPLPNRASSVAEWGAGAAIGWGACLAGVFPVFLSRNLHAQIGLSVGSVAGAGLTALTLLVWTLAAEVIWRGTAFQRLSRALSPSWASALTSAGFAGVLVWSGRPAHLFPALLVEWMLGLVLATAWLRTHGLWLGWGLHFGLRAVMAAVLGLPIAGRSEFGSPTTAFMTGPRWLTGGAFGLDATVWMGLVLLGSLAVLYRTTRQYAWEYTAPVLVGAGYEVAVAPPAAHVAMEKAAAPPALVQILPVTSQSRSAGEVPPQ
jgi:membrane protease YdiL (CAAX protease family)